MKTGTIIGVTLGVAGAAAIGYYLWQRSQGQSTLAPPTTQPSTPMVPTGIIESGKQLITTAVDAFNAFKPKIDPNWENKIVRVNKREIYLVKDGVMRYIEHLPLADGRGFEARVEVTSPPLPIGPPLTKAEGLTGVVYGMMFQ